MTTAVRPVRYVEQVMGMPISLALRGLHTDDAEALGAWAEAVAALRDVDRVFSTYRQDSFVSRLGRGELTLDDCPPEVAEVLALGELARLQSHGAFDVRRGGVLDPSGVVKGGPSSGRPGRCGRCPRQTSASAQAATWCATWPAPASPDWRIGIEDPHDPTRVLAVVPVRNGAVATSGLAHRGGHVVDARTGAVPDGPDVAASVTVVHDDLVWADLDATAAFALGRDAARWLRTRARRTGLVVWADGSTEVVG